jgi:ankyrin repeat protein
MPSIFDAITDNDLRAVRRMLKSNPELHRTINGLGNTPLHEAIRLGCPEIASELIRVGAEVNALGDLGKTPLHYASERDQPTDLARLLVEAGADMAKPNKAGETPLHIAAAQNHEVAGLLLQHGAKLDLNSAVSLGRAEQVRQLLEQDPKLRNAPFPDKLLWQAVRANSTEILRTLLSHGLKPDNLTLFEALGYVLSDMRDMEILRMLLDARADPNGKLYGRTGETPLQYVRNFGGEHSASVISLLREYGAAE